MKTKKEIVTSLVENKHITFEEALTLLDYGNPLQVINYPTYGLQPGTNNPYTVMCNSNLNNEWTAK